METAVTCKSYEIKKSRSGDMVPVVNDIHLHSIYDPHREAQKIVSKYKDELARNPKVLVLGLGFGFHVTYLYQYLSATFGDEIEIHVVEPMAEIVEDATNLKLVPEASNIVIHTNTIQTLYQKMNFLKFLSEKPVVISHPASFNLHKKYYTSFLTYKASNKVGAIVERLKDQTIKECFQEWEDDQQFQNVMEQKFQSGASKLTQNDFLLGAFYHLTNSKQIEVQSE